MYEILVDISSRSTWSYETITSFPESTIIWMWKELRHEKWIDRGQEIMSDEKTDEHFKKVAAMWDKK